MPNTDRRIFLGTMGAGLASLLAPRLTATRPTSSARRMLVLGGTRFLGPAVVDAALAAGYEVTLFNRGKSAPELYSDLEQLRGDRDTGDLSALEGRAFDVVVDTSGYVPAHVSATAELLRENAELYVFISTVSVYPDQSAATVDEDTALAEVPEDFVAETKTIRASFRHYGGMKALCERAANAAMPGKVANLRAGLIVGPRDSSDRFTYWPARVARGGDVLAPGDGTAEVQFVDVRDLGEWVVHLCSNRIAGTFNTVGFEERLSFAQLLGRAASVLESDCNFVWVPESFLLENEVRPYMEMPLWLPAGQRGHFDNSKALAAGLKCRPIGETIRDTQEWHATRTDHEWRRAGMRAEREAELLAAWRAKAPR